MSIPKVPRPRPGIAAGDVLVSLEGEPIENRVDLSQKIGAMEPGTEVEIEVRRAGAVRKLKLDRWRRLPEGLPPGELPSATGARAAGSAADAPAVGAMPLKIARVSQRGLGVRARVCGPACRMAW